jgi:site-specific recombinase XerD
VRAGIAADPAVHRTSYLELEQMLLDDYCANGKKSLDRMEDACGHLRAFFGLNRARQITTPRILRYIRQRQEVDSVANATINRELAALKRMFSLVRTAGKVTLAQCPHIPMLREDNVRSGFLEPEAFRALVGDTSADLAPLLQASYITGWRIRAELLTRQRHDVDLRAGFLSEAVHCLA